MAPASAKQIKNTIRQLKTEKGIASKAVGEAKKKGQETGELIARVKQLSERLKSLESDLKESPPRAEHSPNSTQLTEQTLLPAQFQERQLSSVQTPPLVVRDDLPDAEWDDYVGSHPNATIYHTTAIRNVIQDTFGHAAHYLAALNENNEIQGVLPLIEMKSRLFGHFLVSLPFFNYGGVLATTTQAEHELTTYAAKLAQQLGVEHIEYRHCHDALTLPSRSEKVAMLLNLPRNPETLWSDIGTKVRAQIKKAKRHKLTLKQGRQELINDFYAVFSQNMRDLGTPVYGKSLFAHMLEHVEESWIVIVYHHQQPVSCGFLVGWRNTVEIPWASTLKQANQWDANMFMYWGILQSAIDKNYGIFDFGRSSRDAPTYRFKKQWGAKPYPLYWHYCLLDKIELPQINPNNPKFKAMVELWKKLPLTISNKVGPLIVKSIP